MDGCLCLWLFVQGELYPTELITLPFQGDNRLFDGNMSTLALSGSHILFKYFKNYLIIVYFTKIYFQPLRAAWLFIPVIQWY